MDTLLRTLDGVGTLWVHERLDALANKYSIVLIELAEDLAPDPFYKLPQQIKAHLQDIPWAMVLDCAALERPRRNELLTLLMLCQAAKRQKLPHFMCCLSASALQTLKMFGAEQVLPIHPDREAACLAAVAVLSASASTGLKNGHW